MPIPAPPADSVRLYRRLLKHVWPYKWVFVAALAGMVVVAAGDAAMVAMLKPIIDQGFVDRDAVFIQWVPWGLLGLATVRGVGAFIDNYCMTWVARHVIQDLRQLMFKRLLRAPVRTYDQTSTAKLTSRLIYDVEQVAAASSTAFRVLFRDAFKALFLLGWMFYISWKLSLLFILIVPLAYFIFTVSRVRFRMISQRIQKSVGGIMHIAKEALQGHRLVKIFSAYDYQQQEFFKVNNHHRQQTMKQATILSVSMMFMVMLSGAGVAGVIWVALEQNISPGVFSSYIASMIMLTKPVRSLARTNLTIQGGLAGAESIFRVMDLEQEIDHGDIEIKNMTAAVRFDGVSFQYRDTDGPALSDISMQIAAGATVALVGVSGSGKSTIASLLLRFYTPSSGQISIDGKPLESVTLQSLRANTAIVTQEIMLLDDTIRRNIGYGEKGKIDEARLRKAAEAANVMEFVTAMPRGLDTMVGEQGVRLSGGQRQRIAIARALYRDAPLLIMDEATSSLDSQSEQHIRAAIARLVKNRTSLIIAHRLSTIENADLIVVLEKGRIVQRGRHGDLLKDTGAGGVYAKLHAAQYNAGVDEV